jgi:hypothetical protein
MTQNPKEVPKVSKPMHVKDLSHKPAKHVVEAAKMASSVETDKNPEKVRKASGSAKKPV